MWVMISHGERKQVREVVKQMSFSILHPSSSLSPGPLQSRAASYLQSTAPPQLANSLTHQPTNCPPAPSARHLCSTALKKIPKLRPKRHIQPMPNACDWPGRQIKWNIKMNSNWCKNPDPVRTNCER